MSRRLRPLLAALPIVALLAMSGPALAAKPKTKIRVEPAQTTAFLIVHGTNGWSVQITAGAYGPRFGGNSVGVNASGPQHQEVDYQHLRGRFTNDGSIEAKLPGVGHIDLRYEPIEHHTVDISSPKHCTSAHTTTDSSGIFRGTIQLHGEGGFTVVSMHSARGELSTYPKQTCRVRVRSKAQAKREREAAAVGLQFEALSATRKLAGGALTFDAMSFPSLLPGSSSPTTEFNVSYLHRRAGMWVSARTRVEAKRPASFTISSPDGSPSEATVEPPVPFEGSAEFTLESPKVASWTGDLRVPVPTLGTVDLTGPQFKSALCETGGCTDTAPHTRIQFVGSFFGE